MAFILSQVSEKDRLRGYMILFIWLNSLFWGLAPLAGWSRIWYEPSHVSCTVDLMQPDVKYISYIILCGVWCYVLPIIAMIYCKIKLKGQTDRSSSSEILYSHKVRLNLFFKTLFIVLKSSKGANNRIDFVVRARMDSIFGYLRLAHIRRSDKYTDQIGLGGADYSQNMRCTQSTPLPGLLGRAQERHSRQSDQIL